MKPAIIGLSGPALTADEARVLQDHNPAGVILFARNIVDPPQLAALTAAIRAAGALVLIDQEGGRVARLRPPRWRAFPPAAALGRLAETDPDAAARAAWLRGALIGAACAAAGIDVVCAPVLELAHPGADPVIGDRALSSDPAIVARLGAAILAGLAAAGTVGVMKHLPGHGRATADSHAALPVVAAPAAALQADLAPFAACAAAAPWAMTAHIVYEAWDDRPATVSPTVIGAVIRGAIGFDGVLVSDDLAMHALAGPPAARARAALEAGCDLALHCSGLLAESAAILDALAPDPALAARLAGTRPVRPDRLDLAALSAEHDDLMRA